MTQRRCVITGMGVLSSLGSTPEELYDALRESGVQYGRLDEMAPLAALSLADTPLSALAEEIQEVDEFLKTNNLMSAERRNPFPSKRRQRRQFSMWIYRFPDERS